MVVEEYTSEGVVWTQEVFERSERITGLKAGRLQWDHNGRGMLRPYSESGTISTAPCCLAHATKPSGGFLTP